MTADSFRALLLNENEGHVHAEVRHLSDADLPDGDVLISVAYSSLNYKDGLAIAGKGRVVRTYPMVPGVDLAGTVVESQSPAWKPGDRVVMNGYGAGETHWGGYSQRARLKGEWLVPLPDEISLHEAAGIGTAGYTATLAVIALEEHGLTPEAGRVVVTGAAGGVGGIAIAMLAAAGYRVVASTGRTELHDYLRALGAHEIVGRDAFETPSKRPLESAQWAGAIDSVGGETLAGLLRTMKPWSSVAACGNAGGNALNTTVLPFILRGVNMLGIDSNYCSQERRRAAWKRLARELPREALTGMLRTEPLERVPAVADEILQGRVRGRVVVDLG